MLYTRDSVIERLVKVIENNVDNDGLTILYNYLQDNYNHKDETCEYLEDDLFQVK